MYQDRGMKKWIGFYLAEHSDHLSEKEKEQPLYQQMAEMEISEILYEAFVSKQKVLVVVNLIEDERYFELTGNVYGYDGDYIIISNRRIRLDSIRHIEVDSTGKWWDYD